LPTGEKAEYYIFEDMLMNEDELEKELSKLSSSSNPKQYQSTNLVNPRVITVHGVTNGAGRLSPNGIIGLRRAITNYNNLGLDISFSLTFGSPNNADILIYRMANSPLQRVMAGYPSAAGDPFGLIIIPDNFDGFNRNQMEHQLTHNIGHCIGMRHSDWQTRESCGAPWSSEAPAQWIFGTATTFEFNSIFNACMHSSTTGEFNTNDIVALRRIY
jgi:hypothetical protein